MGTAPSLPPPDVSLCAGILLIAADGWTWYKPPRQMTRQGDGRARLALRAARAVDAEMA
jgi:hypothetical protein